MKCITQNEKIKAITDETIVVGIDIGSETHYARAFTNRQIELSKEPFAFSNSEEGFAAFDTWLGDLMKLYEMNVAIAGMEPTGHYWFNIGAFLQDNGIKVVHVNPHHVKKTKELDDNTQNKNDRKDPKLIATLVNEGRYMIPYIPTGLYAEIRSLSNQRLQAQESLTRAKNRLAKWFSVYFPEYKDVYVSPDAISGLMVLKQAPLPRDIVALGAEGVNKIWREAKLRGCGLKKAARLVDAAKHSIGNHEAPDAARIEIKNLLDDVEMYARRVDGFMEELQKKMVEIPYVEKLLGIRGVGIKTVVGFVAEVGEIGRFTDPKQIQKLAGYAIVSCESGKHKGESHISYRGRKRLRYLLYEAALSVVARNEEFKQLHHYYTTRARNPLKKMQSLIAIACKLIRVFYVILTKGVDYDGQKMLSDIRRPEEMLKAA